MISTGLRRLCIYALKYITRAHGAIVGAARLWSVPSAMVAQKALSVTGDPVMINGGAVYILNNVGIGTNTPGTTKLAVMGDDAQSADALFEVKRKCGR